MNLTFAIGDVHGCLGDMVAMIQRCDSYAKGRDFKFVFLGDYIDRGEDSRGVVQTLRKLQTSYPGDFVCLKGNHEDMLLSVVDEPGNVMWWINNGGETTLTSYGVGLLKDIPADDLAWMRSLPLFHDDGQRFFVHAGVDPTIPLDQQTEQTMLWTRARYPETLNPGRFIVHGHTPLRSRRPEQEQHRINLDTGAVFGGPLSAAVFSDERREPIALLVGDEVVEATEAA